MFVNLRTIYEGDMKFCRVKAFFLSVFMIIMLFNSQTVFSSGNKNCTIFGQIADDQTNEGLAFASVQITSTIDSTFYKGVMSDINGSL